MKLTPEAARAFHCPRWEELPAISLYMDQVIIVMEEVVGIFADERERVLTSTMVNNYVKQRLIAAPEKKKYGREQIAALLIVSVFKRVFSLPEIATVITVMVAEYGAQPAYDMFCERLEAVLAVFFDEQNGGPKASTHLSGLLAQNDGVLGALNSAMIALAGKLYTQCYLQTLLPTADDARPKAAKT